MSNLEIANEILRQLGGNKFIVMTGAKNLVASANSLSFKIGKNNNINHVSITLNGKDLYDIKFSYIRAGKVTIKKEFNDIYNDQIVELFEKTTGMYTKL